MTGRTLSRFRALKHEPGFYDLTEDVTLLTSVQLLATWKGRDDPRTQETKINQVVSAMFRTEAERPQDAPAAGPERRVVATFDPKAFAKGRHAEALYEIDDDRLLLLRLLPLRATLYEGQTATGDPVVEVATAVQTIPLKAASPHHREA